MNKIVIVLLLGVLVVTGCSKQKEAGSVASKPVVCTVNYPLAYFAERIAGDRGSVVFPEIDGDPAFWNPSVEEIAVFQKADLILLNGAGYANWVPKVSLPQAKLVNTTAKVIDRYIPLDGGETHAHGPGGAHVHGQVAFTTWLDPQLAIRQATAIRYAFARQWPDLADEFESRFNALKADLQTLDAELASVMSAYSSQPLVGSHPVYQYLTRHYNLDLESVHWEPDGVPDQHMQRELDDILETHPAKIMLWEGVPMDETKAMLGAKGIESIVFDPCGNRPDAGDYLSVMKSNLRNLQ